MSEPLIAQRGPFEADVKAGKSYAWCACGRSRKQPFCDGSHASTPFRPVVWKAKEDDGKFMSCCGAFTQAETDLFASQESQQVIPACHSEKAAGCESLHHTSVTVVEALCRCGHADHPRLKKYARTLLQLHGMFGYFCSCWGLLDANKSIEDNDEQHPQFDHSPEEHAIALNAVPYRYARDDADLQLLAVRPWFPTVGRDGLTDTNYQPPYLWRDMGADDHYALVGTWWQNGDCWAKANRALSQFAAWPGSIAEFLGLFQCHLYQNSLGAWPQAYPAAMLRWLSEATRLARRRNTGHQRTR